MNIPLRWWDVDFSLSQLVYQPPHVLDCEKVNEICKNDMTMLATAKKGISYNELIPSLG